LNGQAICILPRPFNFVIQNCSGPLPARLLAGTTGSLARSLPEQFLLRNT